jgi:type IV pilus assembly protein PilE
MKHRSLGPRGFTLIELMVVLLIIAVLATLAYPSYTEHVARSRRSDAKAALQDAAQWMERQFTVSNNYSMTANSTAINSTYLATAPLKANSSSISAYYTLSFASGPTSSSYTLQMVPIGAMSTDRCGTFYIDQAASTSVSAGAAASVDCWNR